MDKLLEEIKNKINETIDDIKKEYEIDEDTMINADWELTNLQDEVGSLIFEFIEKELGV